ncbi:NADH-quinone oxidoreductase subunit J family protein [Rudanella paleaurantiibacter]|uniref:NADH-quinone oxidoreductase subunit J family protein n=1 Tax=Rudanella paleaurantiibacter TaxID=2614655 RepID=UPI0016245FCC|nr:NADH-quinone oxidoreductase subunit J [Rudanella paleaurantiibacter]
MIQLVILLFSALALGGAVAILLTRNVLYSAFFLLLTLLGVAALFVLASADFLAVAQIMIYVGGVLVLIVFGVMLTHKADPLNRNSQRPNAVLTNHRSWLWPLVLAGGTFTVLYQVLTRGSFVLLNREMKYQTTVDTIGRQLMTEYLIPFEIAGILLLVALIGAAYLAKPNDA